MATGRREFTSVNIIRTFRDHPGFGQGQAERRVLISVKLGVEGRRASDFHAATSVTAQPGDVGVCFGRSEHHRPIGKELRGISSFGLGLSRPDLFGSRVDTGTSIWLARRERHTAAGRSCISVQVQPGSSEHASGQMNHLGDLCGAKWKVTTRGQRLQ